MGLGIVAIEAYPTHSNVSPLFFGIALALVFVLPIGVIFSVTNVEVTLNVFAEFVGGLAYPGSALQMNYFSRYFSQKRILTNLTVLSRELGLRNNFSCTSLCIRLEVGTLYKDPS
jgi:hypothetical protein